MVRLGASKGQDLYFQIPVRIVPADNIEGEAISSCHPLCIISPGGPETGTISCRYSINLIEDCKKRNTSFISRLREIQLRETISGIYDDIYDGTRDLLIKKVPLNIHEVLSISVSREKARSCCRQLKKYIALRGATDGISLLHVQLHTIPSLGHLNTNIDKKLLKERGLWMYKPQDGRYREYHYASWCTNEIVRKLTSKNAASTISHHCHEPNRTVFRGTTLEACLQITMYSLIVQLLKVRPNLDKFKVSLKKLKSLGMKNTDWETVLTILENLILETTSGRFCIIQWLAAMEHNEVMYKSKQFLDLLVH